jgi:hypothetical protein
LLHFADATGKAFQEEHDLHDLKWKFLPFTPKFWTFKIAADSSTGTGRFLLEPGTAPELNSFAVQVYHSRPLLPSEKDEEVDVSGTPEQQKRVRFDGDEIGNLYHKQQLYAPPHGQPTYEVTDRVTNADISEDKTRHLISLGFEPCVQEDPCLMARVN